jgi:HSP90 family molecular chaperone
MRWNSVNGGASKLLSLDNYVDNMKEGQEKIFYVLAQTHQGALTSPYMEPFKNSVIDVLVLSNNVDEILFNQNSEYKGKKFVSIETSFD